MKEHVLSDEQFKEMLEDNKEMQDPNWWIDQIKLEIECYEKALRDDTLLEQIKSRLTDKEEIKVIDRALGDINEKYLADILDEDLDGLEYDEAIKVLRGKLKKYVKMATKGEKVVLTKDDFM